MTVAEKEAPDMLAVAALTGHNQLAREALNGLSTQQRTDVIVHAQIIVAGLGNNTHIQNSPVITDVWQAKRTLKYLYEQLRKEE